jgi:hypothetical protein
MKYSLAFAFLVLSMQVLCAGLERYYRSTVGGICFEASLLQTIIEIHNDFSS